MLSGHYGGDNKELCLLNLVGTGRKRCDFTDGKVTVDTLIHDPHILGYDEIGRGGRVTRGAYLRRG